MGIGVALDFVGVVGARAAIVITSLQKRRLTAVLLRAVRRIEAVPCEFFRISSSEEKPDPSMPRTCACAQLVGSFVREHAYTSCACLFIACNIATTIGQDDCCAASSVVPHRLYGAISNTPNAAPGRIFLPMDEMRRDIGPLEPPPDRKLYRAFRVRQGSTGGADGKAALFAKRFGVRCRDGHRGGWCAVRRRADLDLRPVSLSTGSTTTHGTFP